MNCKHLILGAVVLASARCGSLKAQGPPPPPAPASETDQPISSDADQLISSDADQPISSDADQPIYRPAESFDEYVGDGSGYAGYYDSYHTPTIAARLGWWGVSTDGSLNKVGEYQNLQSGPFWDIDGLTSDGYRTLDFNATGTDNETSDLDLNYYQPEFSTKIRYNRFVHRLDHDPLEGLGTPGDAPYIGPIEDFNAGEDYAIRVQKLDARFKG